MTLTVTAFHSHSDFTWSLTWSWVDDNILFLHHRSRLCSEVCVTTEARMFVCMCRHLLFEADCPQQATSDRTYLNLISVQMGKVEIIICCPNIMSMHAGMYADSLCPLECLKYVHIFGFLGQLQRWFVPSYGWIFEGWYAACKTAHEDAHARCVFAI